MPHAIVTGASGMLGTQVVKVLSAEKWTVDGWTHHTLSTRDTQFQALEENRVIGIGRANLVINCAAVTAAGLDAEYVREVNAHWPARLALACKETGARFIHISSTAVYARYAEGLRTEDAALNATPDLYTDSKILSEKLVAEVNPDATIVRCTMFGRSLPDHRLKLAEKILHTLMQDKPLALWNDYIFSPLYTADLACLLMELVSKHVPGVINLGTSDTITQIDFGLALAKACRIDSSKLVGVGSDPHNMGLDVAKARALLGELPTVRETIDHFALDGT